jgi:hypothetical protein
MPAWGVGVSLAALALGPAGVCLAQPTIQLRLVERTGQTEVTSSDAVLNFAVQGRVVGDDPGVGIGGFAFAIVINGEAQNRGTFSRDRISNPDGTYYSGIAGPATGFMSGVDAQHGYLVGINSVFNGLINASGGGWTQTPSQDIGLISGLSAGPAFLNTPGVDADQDGVPDTNSDGVAKLPPSIMTTYFGADNNWIDLYRFRYTVTNFTPRDLDFHIISTSSDLDPVGFTFTDAEETSGSWGTINTQVSIPPQNVEGFVGTVLPSPGAGATMLAATGWIARRRRQQTMR